MQGLKFYKIKNAAKENVCRKKDELIHGNERVERILVLRIKRFFLLKHLNQQI